MRFGKLIVSAVVMSAVFFGCTGSSRSQTPELIHWLTDHNTALAMAKKTDKPVLIDFYADWCGWCKKMTNVTYADKNVADTAKSFVCLKINTDRNPALARDYHVSGLPTTVFLKPDGTTIANIPGYEPPDVFLQQMNKVLSFLKK